jgi:hypothetical protein
MKSALECAAMALACFAAGIYYVVWPERVKRSMLRSHEKHKVLARLNPFRSWMETPGYILYLRLGGVIMLISGCGLLYLTVVIVGDVLK